jgi:HK97 family phage major capsid protein
LNSNKIVGDDLWNIFFSIKTPYSNKATWVMHRSVISQVRQRGRQQPIFWNPTGLLGDSMINGYTGYDLRSTLHASEYAPSYVTTSGAYYAVFGNFGEYYWIARRSTMRIKKAMEKYMDTDQIGYFARAGMDGMPVLGEAFARGKMQ